MCQATYNKTCLKRYTSNVALFPTDFFLQVPELREDQYDNVFMLKRDIVPRYRMAFRKQKDKENLSEELKAT